MVIGDAARASAVRAKIVRCDESIERMPTAARTAGGSQSRTGR